MGLMNADDMASKLAEIMYDNGNSTEELAWLYEKTYSEFELAESLSDAGVDINPFDYSDETNTSMCPKCITCAYYRNDTELFPGQRVCVKIDESYTQHSAGYFMPNPDFGCLNHVVRGANGR
jgi:hypothetical protein